MRAQNNTSSSSKFDTPTAYAAALNSLSSNVRGELFDSWTKFKSIASNRRKLIILRDSFESFPQYFQPLKINDKSSGKTISDPYELLLYYVDGIYKSIGDYSDDNTSTKKEKVCVDYLKNALTVFGSSYSPASVECKSDPNYILTGDVKLAGTSITWNDYFNTLKTSTQLYFPSARKVKYQYWIKGISPDKNLNDLDNMGLLIISQCTSALSAYVDLLKLKRPANQFLTGNYTTDTPAIDTFHALRKVLRSLVRSFTAYPQISPLTFYEKTMNCSTANCCLSSQYPIGACLINLNNDPAAFINIMKSGTDPSILALTGIYLLGEKTDCADSCITSCSDTSKSCDTTANVKSCGNTNCTNSGCDWVKCDLVSWFGNIHDNMVEYLFAADPKQGYSGIESLVNWINSDVSNMMNYLSLYLPKYLNYIMHCTWKKSFENASNSKNGKLMLHGPSSSNNGWLCWDDSMKYLSITQ